MSKVEIYSSELCGFCWAAKRLLDNKKVVYEEYSVDMRRDVKHEMVERSGGRTSVPQIFIDNHHVGGFDDISEMERTGKLDIKLGLSDLKL